MIEFKRSDHRGATQVRNGAAADKTRAATPLWVLTPTQAVLGIKPNLGLRMSRWTGGLAFGFAVGVAQGIRMRRRTRRGPGAN